MAYILEGVKHLQNIKSYQMKVTYKTIENNGFGETEECEKVVEDDFIFGMITNSLSVGGFKSLTGNVMGKNVVLNDGLFEVTLVKMPKNPVELNSILVALMSEKVDTEFMYCLKSSELLIESQEEVAWTLDGEYGGKHTCVKLKNKQKAIDILVPTENLYVKVVCKKIVHKKVLPYLATLLKIKRGVYTKNSDNQALFSLPSTFLILCATSVLTLARPTFRYSLGSKAAGLL